MTIMMRNEGWWPDDGRVGPGTSPRFGYIIPDPLILLMFVKNCHISLLKCSCNATKKRGEVRLLPNNLTVLLICNPRISMS